jgi:hypothetical protein
MTVKIYSGFVILEKCCQDTWQHISLCSQSFCKRYRTLTHWDVDRMTSNQNHWTFLKQHVRQTCSWVYVEELSNKLEDVCQVIQS